MTMERPAGAAVRELARYRHQAKRRDLEWPEECLESERRFGTRAARLYPLISHEQKADGRITNGNAVRTPEGIGTLTQVIGGEARVLLMKTKATKTLMGATKRYRPTTSFPVEEISPYRKGA